MRLELLGSSFSDNIMSSILLLFINQADPMRADSMKEVGENVASYVLIAPFAGERC
jgi:hypothetical protein